MIKSKDSTHYKIQVSLSNLELMTFKSYYKYDKLLADKQVLENFENPNKANVHTSYSHPIN